MIKIETLDVLGMEHAIYSMRNPYNSWDRSDSDSENAELTWRLGNKDRELALNLSKGGPVHAKYRRMIVVYADITAPLYWWKEFDTYKVGTVANSCSTMHKIQAKGFELDDFSHDHLTKDSEDILRSVIRALNKARAEFNEEKDKSDWWQMIQLLPSSYNQKRTVMMNYEVLSNIYVSRAGHRLDEWHRFRDWIEELPNSELIVM